MRQETETMELSKLDQYDVGQKRFDDQSLSVFVQNELNQITGEMYDRRYPELDAKLWIPLKTGINAGASSWSYDSFDGGGRAEFMGANATDIPRVDVGKTRHTFPIHEIVLSYGWTLREMMSARFANVPLDRAKAERCRRGIEEKEQSVLLLGEPNLGIPGFLTNPAVPMVSVPNGNWLAGATGDQVLQDLNFLIDRAWLGTKKVHKANTLLLPNEQFRYVQTKARTSTSDKTILSYFQDTNPGVQVGMLTELESAGPDGVAMAMAYQKAPDMLGGVIPLPFTQLEPQFSGFEVLIPCWEFIGGTVFHYPLSATYVIGI